ncbi:hypothetical protein EJ02DRAFT_77175 [Clathrospora elynae]|uniref:Uncharacterized protein n=1 Tax=Clathrospora elynae TaxID=706981 RepID=A0A6A5SYD5_9PLEO|nr:hypothetical protein EJ02DRAFT_77175 [Clathrospora elynae]
MPKRMRAPNCTHVDMDRVYGRDLQCYVCGRSPSIGFLYECRQDSDAVSLHDLIAQDENKIEPVKSELRVQLESIGLSESIIRTAEGGHYSNAQLTKLKELKLELKQTISDTRQASQANEDMSRLAAMAKAPSNTDGSSNSMPTRDAGSPPGCTFRACHTCRPYYRDRVYISFQSVLAADFAPITRADVESLPIKSSRIMRTIGNKAQPLPSSMTLDTDPCTLPNSTSFATSTDAPQTASSTSTDSSDLTFKTTQTDIEEISAQRRPRRRFYKMGRRSSSDIAHDLSRVPSLLTPQGLKSAVQGIFHPGRESSSSGSNITLPLARTGTVRRLHEAQPVGEFDLGALRRVRKQKERNELRNGTYIGGFESGVVLRPGSSHFRAGDAMCENSSSDSEFSVYSFATEGSEVEVEDGGVALTEEAVESRTPDLIVVGVPATQKTGAVVTTDRVDEDDATGADIGLQSIMAQV